MRRAALLVPPLLLAGFCAPIAAQKLLESPQGFRLKLPKGGVEVTLDPKERIVRGMIDFPIDDHTCRAWIVRYRKAEAATTGPGGAESDKQPSSLKDQAILQFNDAHSLQELLDLRTGKDNFKVEPGKDKPLKFADGTEAVGYAARGTRGEVRAWIAADGSEEFGIIGFGHDGKELERVIRTMAESLAFTAPSQAAAAPAIAANLRDPEFRQQVRSKLMKGWDAHDTENFVLISNCTNKAIIARLLGDLEIMRRCYLERFPPIGPMEKVSLVRVFKSYEEYASYGKLPGAIGHFSPLDDELVLFDPGTKFAGKRSEWLKDVDTAEVLYHEAMHQYLHEANGLLAPASWFGEGFGEVFAGAVLDRRKESVTKIERNKGRMTWIKRSQKSGGWPDLRAFVRMTQPDFYGPSVYQNYAFAWAFCHFLEEERKDPKGNKEWGAIADRYLASLREITAEFRKKLPDDAPKDWIMAVRFEIQEEAFDRTFKDTDWGALEKAWIAAMKKW